MGKIAVGHNSDKIERLSAELQGIMLKHNILFLPDYGTLLGTCRESGMIKWDTDADFSVYPGEDHQTNLKLAYEEMSNNGWNQYLKPSDRRLDDATTAGVRAYKEGIKFDIFVWRRYENAAQFQADHPHIPLDRATPLHEPFWGRKRYAQTDHKDGKGYFTYDHWLENLETKDFGQHKLQVSTHWDQWLTHRYGNWKEPVLQETKKGPSTLRAYYQAIGYKRWEAAQMAYNEAITNGWT
jgi:phosphorylcholine metabolism protein LicD